MNKKNIVIGIIISLVLFTFSFLFASFSSSELKCDELDGKDKDLCFLKLAKEKENTQGCENIKDFVLNHLCLDEFWNRQNCDYEKVIGEGELECISNNDQKYLGLAIKKNNAEHCRKIIEDELEEECLCKVNFNVSCEEKEFHDAITLHISDFSIINQFVSELLNKQESCSNVEDNVGKISNICYFYSLNEISESLSLSDFDYSIWTLFKTTKEGMFDCHIFNEKEDTYSPENFYNACTSIISKNSQGCEDIDIGYDVKLYNLKNICESWSKEDPETCTSNQCIVYFIPLD